MAVQNVTTGVATGSTGGSDGSARKSRPTTAAERAFIDSFAAAAGELPGTGWVDHLRQTAIQSFAAEGLPSRRIEAFKYTDLRERVKVGYAPPTASTKLPAEPIGSAALDAALGAALAGLAAHRLVFIDGIFDAALSRTEGLAESAEFMPLAPLLRKAPGWLEGKFAPNRLIPDADAVSHLNTAFMSDGLLIKIKPGLATDQPVMIINARSSAAPATVTTRNLVAMEAGARMTLIEVDVALKGAAGQAIVNTLTDVAIADGASLDHVKLNRDNAQAVHLSVLSADVAADAVYRVFQFTPGAGLVRNTTGVRLSGTGSRLDVSGAFLGRGTDHIDTTLLVDHAAPGCESRELFKCVLDDRARGVFQGKIVVRQGADKTDGKQMARALMLSQDAEFDSKPELEIFADDVACGHGATTAELDPAMLFYCRSRGIAEPEARALLIEAFVGEAIDKIADEAVRSALMSEAEAWLREERSARPGSP